MKYIDDFLNKITMYKLVLYGLFILVGLAMAFSFLGFLSYSPLSLIFSFFTLTVSCYVSNIVFAKLLRAQTNIESSSITALILFCLVFPVESFTDFGLVALVGILAMASKYFLAIKKKHVFNPAAISFVILGLFGQGLASWWIGSSVMFLPVLVFVFLVLRKLKRFQMFSVFLGVGLLSTVVFSLSGGFTIINIWEILKLSILSGPILFLGGIMLTEPQTAPPTWNLQILYAVIVGALFGFQFDFGFLYATPELALVLGNVFSYIVSPKLRLVLSLVEKKQLTKDTYEFVWKRESGSPRAVFKAGQYMEWTLEHSSTDSRGNRRYFTIASSPTEENISLGIKFYDNGSSFKKKLVSLNAGDKIVAGSLAGDFTLPKDPTKKLVFIAGGIGVTPFRSMIKYLVDRGERRDIVLFFSNRTPNDVVYRDIFIEAKNKINLKTIYVVNDALGQNLDSNFRIGMINEEMIRVEVPDFSSRMFYISGPHVMITAFENTLSKMGVENGNIRTDFFPGYV